MLAANPALPFIKGGIGKVNIFAVQTLAHFLDGLSETLEVDNFPLTQEADHITYIRIIAETKDIVIRESRWLPWDRLLLYDPQNTEQNHWI